MSRHYSAIYNSIYSHVIAKLQNELSPRLTYHSIGHTFDVLKQSQQIAAREDISDEQNLFLLKIAALYHDCGFIFIYGGHEEKGCEIARGELPGFGLSSQWKKLYVMQILITLAETILILSAIACTMSFLTSGL